MGSKAAQRGSKENDSTARVKSQKSSSAHAPASRDLAASLLGFQRTHGNRFVQRLINGAANQLKSPSESASITGERGESKDESVSMKRSANGNELTAVPPIVHAVLRSPGQPLDQDTRTFMEPRFGQDFSQVRVHTEGKAAESARAVNALAFTVGRNIVFGAGQYQLQSRKGRALLAHELAHTIQQENTTSIPPAENAALERVANAAALSVALNGSTRVSPAVAAPAIQFLRVTEGGFGKALEQYMNVHEVNPKAVPLLRSSKTFMRLAKQLDDKYVWHLDADHENVEYGPHREIIKGPHHMINKRALFVAGGPPRFTPFESPDVGVGPGDTIWLGSSSVNSFIRDIAHEATHAALFLGASAPSPKTLMDEISKGIEEEIKTRKSEAKILGEILSPAVRAKLGTGSRVPAEVERDWSPGLKLTYLEHYFFAWRMNEAQKADQLTDNEAVDIRIKVDNTPEDLAPVIFSPRPDRTTGRQELSEYAKVLFHYRTAQREWEDFFNKHPEKNDLTSEQLRNDPDYQRLVQDHATSFFEGRVSYSAFPAHVGKP